MGDRSSGEIQYLHTRGALTSRQRDYDPLNLYAAQRRFIRGRIGAWRFRGFHLFVGNSGHVCARIMISRITVLQRRDLHGDRGECCIRYLFARLDISQCYWFLLIFKKRCDLIGKIGCRFKGVIILYWQLDF